MQNKLLIYIPSYNRRDLLLRQLNRIANDNLDGVQVVVRDNCSGDMYADIQKFCEDKNFLYEKNFVNIGANANIASGFMYVNKAEYLWVLSDDDTLKDGALNLILELLNNFSPDILYFTHSKIEKPLLEQWVQKDFLDKNIYTADGAGLISSVIYKSDFIKESAPQAFENIFTCFQHLAVQFHAFKDKKADVLRVGSYMFFEPDSADPAHPYSYGYSKSFFGYVFLAELLESEKLKREFLDKWSNFWIFRHWHFKYKNGGFMGDCAKAYLVKNTSFYNLVSVKIFFWKLLSPLLSLLKASLSRNMKNKILGFLKIGF